MGSALTAFLVRGGRVPVTSLVGVAISVVFAGILILAAVGIGLASVYLWLREPLGPPLASLSTAGCALLLAGISLALARRMQAQVHVPNPVELATDLVRQYPLESALAALAAGLAVGGSEQVRESLASALSSSLRSSS